MRNEKLPFVLFAAGVALVIFAICWSLYALGEVGQLVGPKGLRPNNSFHCVPGFGAIANCSGPRMRKKARLGRCRSRQVSKPGKWGRFGRQQGGMAPGTMPGSRRRPNSQPCGSLRGRQAELTAPADNLRRNQRSSAPSSGTDS